MQDLAKRQVIPKGRCLGRNAGTAAQRLTRNPRLVKPVCDTLEIDMAEVYTKEWAPRENPLCWVISNGPGGGVKSLDACRRLLGTGKAVTVKGKEFSQVRTKLPAGITCPRQIHLVGFGAIQGPVSRSMQV